jgi:hypothetical protein
VGGAKSRAATAYRVIGHPALADGRPHGTRPLLTLFDVR